jgi:hypothetical protein
MENLPLTIEEQFAANLKQIEELKSKIILNEIIRAQNQAVILENIFSIENVYVSSKKCIKSDVKLCAFNLDKPHSVCLFCYHPE